MKAFLNSYNLLIFKKPFPNNLKSITKLLSNKVTEFVKVTRLEFVQFAQFAYIDSHIIEK